MSRSTKALGLLINKFVETYTQEHFKSPSVEEIAQHFDITSSDVVFAMESSHNPISLYSQVGVDDENKQQLLIDKIPNDNPIDNNMDSFSLLKIINNLPPRDKKIILLRYFRDKTQSEIAKELGVSQVQVSRLENKIIGEIKAKMIE